jgi:hypothetical protein
MAENKINVNLNVPDDCVNVLKIFLDRATQKGMFGMDDVMIMGFAIRNLQTYIRNNSHEEKSLDDTHAVENVGRQLAHI